MTTSILTSVYLISIISILIVIGLVLLGKDLFTTISYNRTMKQVRKRWNEQHNIK